MSTVRSLRSASAVRTTRKSTAAAATASMTTTTTTASVASSATTPKAASSSLRSVVATPATTTSTAAASSALEEDLDRATSTLAAAHETISQLQKQLQSALAFNEEASNLYKLATAHDAERADLKRRNAELDFELGKLKTSSQINDIRNAKEIANLAEKLTLWLVPLLVCGLFEISVRIRNGCFFVVVFACAQKANRNWRNQTNKENSCKKANKNGKIAINRRFRTL